MCVQQRKFWNDHRHTGGKKTGAKLVNTSRNEASKSRHTLSSLNGAMKLCGFVANSAQEHKACYKNGSAALHQIAGPEWASKCNDFGVDGVCVCCHPIFSGGQLERIGRQNAKRLRRKIKQRWDGIQTSLSDHARNFSGVAACVLSTKFVGCAPYVAAARPRLEFWKTASRVSDVRCVPPKKSSPRGCTAENFPLE